MLGDIISTIKTKYVVRAALGMVGLILLITFLSGGFVLIRSPHDAVMGFSQRTDSDDGAKDPLNIGQGGWKLAFLGTGDYHIEFSSGNKKTLYQPSVGIFSFQVLDIKLSQQHQSQSIGIQNSDCSLQPPSLQIVYYNCNKSMEDQRTVALTEDGFTFNNFPAGESVVPYREGLLQIDDFSGQPQAAITATTYNNNVVASSASSSFGASFDNVRLVTDSQDSNNRRFVYYDGASKKAYMFKDLSSAPQKLDVTPYLKKDGFSLDFMLDGDSLYVYYGIKQESASGFGDEKPLTKTELKDQGIAVFNADNLAKEGQIELPDNLLVDRLSADKGNVAFSAYTLENNKAGLYVIPQGKNESKLAFYGQTLDLCFNEGTLYYLSDENAVYEYQPSNRASYLAYESQNHSPVNLNCTYGNVSFPAQAKEGGDSDYTWTLLGRGVLGSDTTRTEDLFPILADSPSRISYAYLFKDTVRVVLDGNGVCGALDEQTSNRTLNHLKDLGINTAEFKIIINYDC